MRVHCAHLATFVVVPMLLRGPVLAAAAPATHPHPHCTHIRIDASAHPVPGGRHAADVAAQISGVYRLHPQRCFDAAVWLQLVRGDSSLPRPRHVVRVASFASLVGDSRAGNGIVLVVVPHSPSDGGMAGMAGMAAPTTQHPPTVSMCHAPIQRTCALAFDRGTQPAQLNNTLMVVQPAPSDLSQLSREQMLRHMLRLRRVSCV